MIHKMNLQDSPFQMIKKKKMIKPEGIIKFNNNHTEEILKAKVI